MNLERGVPIPTPSFLGWERRRKFPWREMAVGDSFLWPAWSQTQYLNGVKAHAAMAAKQVGNEGKSFRAYKNKETGEIRVWRVK